MPWVCQALISMGSWGKHHVVVGVGAGDGREWCPEEGDICQ